MKCPNKKYEILFKTIENICDFLIGFIGFFIVNLVAYLCFGRLDVFGIDWHTLLILPLGNFFLALVLLSLKRIYLMPYGFIIAATLSLSVINKFYGITLLFCIYLVYKGWIYGKLDKF